MERTLEITEKLKKRFFDSILKTDGCWIWKGSKTSTGYGVFRFGHSGRIKAHRFSYYLHFGILPDIFVLHSCDNPLCVNPEHLRQGTHKENVQDMVLRKRHANQVKTHCPKGHKYSLENTYLHKNGSRRCKQCASLRCLAKSSIAEVPIWSS